MKPFPRWLTGGLSRSQYLALLCGILAVAALNLLLSLFAPPGAHAEIAADSIAAVLAIILTPYLLRTLDAAQKQAARQNSELRSLHAIDGALNKRLELSAILSVAVQEAARAVDAERGALWLYQEGGSTEVQARAFYNISPALQELVGASLETRDISWVRQGQKPVRRTELGETWQQDRTADLLKLRSTITVPILRENTLLGALLIINRGGPDSPDGFSDDDESLLSAIAVTLSAAVQNARLFEESQRRGEVLRTLIARTGEALAASYDAPKLMQILAEEAARILDCAHVGVYAHDSETAAQNNAAVPFHLLAAHGDNQARTFPLTLEVDPHFLPTGKGETPPYTDDISHALGLTEHADSVLEGPGYLFVLRARDSRGIGLLVLRDKTTRPGLPERDAFAQTLAAQAGSALENADLFAALQKAYARERRIAETFQHSLMPDIPTESGEFQFAQKYQAALAEAQIGGDFYDVFTLPNGKTALVMADVSGKGLQAAVQTARIRYTLRAFATEQPDKPADVLHRVNNSFCAEEKATDGFVTLFYGVLDTQNGHMTFASAGHEPPILCAAGETSSLPSSAGLPLGIFSDVDYPQNDITLRHGETFLLFTDGLSESRDADGHMLGAEGICELMPTDVTDAETLADEVFALVQHWGGGSLQDDAALLVVRRREL